MRRSEGAKQTRDRLLCVTAGLGFGVLDLTGSTIDQELNLNNKSFAFPILGNINCC